MPRADGVATAAAAQTPSKRTRLRDGNDENYDPHDIDADDSEDQDSDDDDAPGLGVAKALPLRRQPSRSLASAKTLAKPPVTPSTPRHRDALGAWPATPRTPRTPQTPRHAVMSAGKLFKRLTPQSPLTPSAVQTVYHTARQLFARGAEPGPLVGRDEERERLTSFLARCSSTTGPSGGCLYVSGAPGTGKSAMVAEVTKAYAGRDGVRSASINCMSVGSSKDLYATLVRALGLDAGVSEADDAAALQQAFCPKATQERADDDVVYQVTLDEMDQLLVMDLESLYRVLEWSLHPSSRLVLIGIANALDLTDRFLPRLKSKNLKAELLPFRPYSAVQVRGVITARLQSLMPSDGGAKAGYVPFIHPAAIELCSRKVASQTGDLRKAFEICRRALDLVETETRSKHEEEAREKVLQMTPSKRPLSEKTNAAAAAAASGPRSAVQLAAASLKALTAETAPRASIGHLCKVTAAAFGNGTTQRLKTLNLQQKVALSSLVAYERRARNAAKKSGGGAAGARTPSKSQQQQQQGQSLAPTVKMLFDAYCQLCTRDSVLHPLSSSEFREVVGSLEALGLVNAVEGRASSFAAAATTPSKRGRRAAASGDERRIASAVSERDLESVTEGVGAGILKSILAGEALDG